MQHKETIVRQSGKLESYVDIPIPVDSSVNSLFIIASLQCMPILLYDPQGSRVSGEARADHWYRAGRISTIPRPAAGQWLLRPAGTGAYSVAVQAHVTQGLHGLKVRENMLWLRLNPEISNPQFRLIGPVGEVIQTLSLEPDPDSPGHYRGTFTPGAAQFRVLVESDVGFQRVDPRLFETRLFEAKPLQ
jgi:hypothetical protein